MLGVKCIAVAFVVAAFIGFSEAQVNGHCVQCNSAVTPFCVRDPPDPLLVLSTLDCTAAENNGCFTSINAQGHTVRGCLSPATRTTCVADALCEPCPAVAGIGTGCNNVRFPAARRTCHQCTGDLNSFCAPAMTGLAPVCELFGQTERCFIHRNGTGITRGCDLNHGTLCQNEAHCHFCSTQGCNAQVFNANNVPVAPGSASMYGTTITLIVAGVAFVCAYA